MRVPPAPKLCPSHSGLKTRLHTWKAAVATQAQGLVGRAERHSMNTPEGPADRSCW